MSSSEGPVDAGPSLLYNHSMNGYHAFFNSNEIRIGINCSAPEPICEDIKKITFYTIPKFLIFIRANSNLFSNLANSEIEFRSKSKINFRKVKISEILNLETLTTTETILKEYRDTWKYYQGVLRASLSWKYAKYNNLIVFESLPVRHKVKQNKEVGIESSYVPTDLFDRQIYIFKNEEDMYLASILHGEKIAMSLSLNEIRKELQKYFKVPIPGISPAHSEIL